MLEPKQLVDKQVDVRVIHVQAQGIFRPLVEFCDHNHRFELYAICHVALYLETDVIYEKKQNITTQITKQTLTNGDMCLYSQTTSILVRVVWYINSSTECSISSIFSIFCI
jgi:hypothetical protein